MELVYQERGSEANAALVVYYSQKDGVENESGVQLDIVQAEMQKQPAGILDSQAFDKSKVRTSLMLFTGKKLDQAIDLDRLIKQDNRQDTIALKANCGVI